MTDPRARLLDLVAATGDSLAALSAMLDRNPAYLQQYVRRGSPRRLDPDDRRRLANYFGIDERELGAEGGPAPFRIDRLDIAASAGPGAQVDDEVVLGAEAIDPALARQLGLQPGRAGIIRVRGTSMEPALLDGDLIVVDLEQRTPGPRGGVFVIRVDGAVMVKRVRRGATGPIATSDNPDAPAVPDGAIEMVGQVVWLMRAPR